MRDNTLIKYLKLAERIDASDIHIKSGKCAIARVSGTLKQIDDAILTKEQVFSFIQDILTEKQMTEFDLYSDVDSSFPSATEGSGATYIATSTDFRYPFVV